MNTQDKRIQSIAGPAITLLAALLWLACHPVFAAPALNLVIHNPPDINGKITVVDGGKVKVSYTIFDTESGNYRKGDKIQLRRVSDDKVVDSVARGKQKTGSVKLRAKNAPDQALYVVYILKGSGAEAARKGHPDDPGFPLVTISKRKLDQLAIEQHAQSIDQQNLWDAYTSSDVDTNVRLDSLEDHLNAVENSVAYVPGGDFLPAHFTDHTQWNRSLNSQHYGFPTNGGNHVIQAGVSLPNGVSIEAVRCYFWDTSTSYDIDIRKFRLVRSAIADTEDLVVASDIGLPTTGSSFVKSLLQDTSVFPSSVDTSQYYYYLNVQFGVSAGHTATTSSALRFYGCGVEYSSTPD